MEQYSTREEIKGFCDSVQYFTAEDDKAALKYAKAQAKKSGRKLRTVRKRIGGLGKPWATIFGSIQ